MAVTYNIKGTTNSSFKIGKQGTGSAELQTIQSPSSTNIVLAPGSGGLVSINSNYTIPLADGSAGQLLVTSGSGTLSFGSSGFPQDMGAITGSTSTFPIGTAPDFGALSGEDLIGPDFGEVNSNASSIFDDVTYTSTDTGSTAGPIIELYRNSASPADSDYLGQIKFQGENDTGGKKNYAKITGKILDASAGSEDGILEFSFMKGGSNNISGRFRSDSLQLLNDTNLRVTGHTELGVVASDPSTTTNFAHIYAKDESASAEVFVRDEAGNVTKISPHNEQGEWEYYSRNVNTGKVVRINMEEMIKDLEALTGKSYIKYE
jgi:hypothetical protein